MKEEIRMEIIRPLGTLCENGRGFTTEVNILRWNDNDPKMDIRQWTPDSHHPMKGGVSLTEFQAMKLYEILKNYFEYGKEVTDANNPFEE